MNTQTFAEAIATRTADRYMLPTVPASADLTKYVVLTDDSGSWILTTEESADALNLGALPNADMTDFSSAEYGEFWASFSEKLAVVIGDCNNPMGAVAALCAREGVEMVEQD